MFVSKWHDDVPLAGAHISNFLAKIDELISFILFVVPINFGVLDKRITMAVSINVEVVWKLSFF